jgi:hypothetical protein
MILGIVALAMAAVGIVLIGIGVAVSLADRKRKLAEGKMETEGTTGKTLEGLAKLADALKDYPLGMQLVFIGVALLLAAAAAGGAAVITA